MNAAITFPVARYRFEFRATQPIRLPDYAGSMLRGAFGHALRHLACMTRQKECTGCPLANGCPYPAIFAPLPPPIHPLQKFTEIPAPQVIEAPAWGSRVLTEGDTLAFHQVLIGRARQELPLIILAWRRAFAHGVGAGDGRAELVRVLHCGQAGDSEIHRPEGGSVDAHVPEIELRRAPVLTGTTLYFATPLRLQENGRALPPDLLRARTLLMALARRANLLAEFHGGGPLLADFSALRQAAAEVRDEKHLVWRDWRRYSSRQRREMRLGGVMGTWRLEGPLDLFATLLQLGEWLHVGKETAFGLGRYTQDTGAPGDIFDEPLHGRERHFQAVDRKEVN